MNELEKALREATRKLAEKEAREYQELVDCGLVEPLAISRQQKRFAARVHDKAVQRVIKLSKQVIKTKIGWEKVLNDLEN